jgi:hypothetical protein
MKMLNNIRRIGIFLKRVLPECTECWFKNDSIILAAILLPGAPLCREVDDLGCAEQREPAEESEGSPDVRYHVDGRHRRGRHDAQARLLAHEHAEEGEVIQVRVAGSAKIKKKIILNSQLENRR